VRPFRSCGGRTASGSNTGSPPGPACMCDRHGDTNQQFVIADVQQVL
jgi:hypothetical protein